MRRRNQVFVCSFSEPLDYRIYVGRKLYRFEFSRMFGPSLVGKRGDLLQDGRALQSERHPFWHGFNAWLSQGEQIDHWTGLCVWREPAPTIIRRIAGRHHIVVRDGERGGETIVLELDEPLPKPAGGSE